MLTLTLVAMSSPITLDPNQGADLRDGDYLG